MNIFLRDGESIEDLQYKGLRMIQNSKGFRFGTDSVLLAGFVNVRERDRVVDLGTGTGVIAILVNGRTGASVAAVEIQAEQCEMARRSVLINNQDIDVYECDMRTAYTVLGTGVFDAAVCNPPYYPVDHGSVSSKGKGVFKGAATHETFCTLSEVAKSAAKLLKFGGKFFICCPVFRLSEALTALSTEKLEPKRLRLVSSQIGKTPYLALIEAKKGAAVGLTLESVLEICDKDGRYTDEANRIYHRENENGI